MIHSEARSIYTVGSTVTPQDHLRIILASVLELSEIMEKPKHSRQRSSEKSLKMDLKVRSVWMSFMYWDSLNLIRVLLILFPTAV